MKRHRSLQPLSDDHHRALVLAMRLQRTSAGMAPTELAALSHEVQRQFEAELEPHFRIEERWLLPALEARGGARLAAQTVADHEHLRALVRGDWSKDTAHELGTCLEKHVRFEERVLFPEAQACLSEAELALVRDATTIRNTDRERRSP